MHTPSIRGFSHYKTQDNLILYVYSGGMDYLGSSLAKLKKNDPWSDQDLSSTIIFQETWKTKGMLSHTTEVPSTNSD